MNMIVAAQFKADQLLNAPIFYAVVHCNRLCYTVVCFATLRYAMLCYAGHSAGLSGLSSSSARSHALV